MTKQEIFDTVCAWFLRDPRKSVRGMSCMYRGEDNTRCFLGVLLTDDEVQEGKSAETIDIPTRMQGHERFLIDVQRAHDHAPEVTFRASAELNLRLLAQNYKLSTHVLDGAA